MGTGLQHVTERRSCILSGRKERDMRLRRKDDTRAIVLPLVIIALSLVVNAYTLTNLFPYVGAMVKHLMGLSTMNESGFYTGYVASAFTFGRFLSAYTWGYLADVWGRKPVMIFALSAICIISIAFGLSESLAFAVGSRLVLGLLNGMMSAARTMTAEICGPEHVVVGMTYVSASRAVGLVVGPAIGGILAQPSVTFPGVFSPDGLFGRHPFLLPNLFGSCFAVVMLIMVVLFIPETQTMEDDRLQSTKSHRDGVDPNDTQQALVKSGTGQAGKPEEGTSSLPRSPGFLGHEEGGKRELEKDVPVGDLAEFAAETRKVTDRKSLYDTFGSGDEDASEANSPFPVEADAGTEDTGHGCKNGSYQQLPQQRLANGDAAPNGNEGGVFGADGLLSVPHVPSILFLICVMSAVIIGLDEAVPLWALSTPDVGGLGWNTAKIGQVLAATGAGVIIFQFILFPPLVKMVHMANVQRFCIFSAIPLILTVPYLRSISWDDQSRFEIFATLMVLHQVCMANMMSAINVSSTCVVSADRRGKMSGLVMTAESFGRFVGPAGFAIAYAWSISPAVAHVPFVDFRSIFFVPALAYLTCGIVAWRSLKAVLPRSPGVRGGAGGKNRAPPGSATNSLGSNKVERDTAEEGVPLV